jgi:hypothetical protein
MGRPPQGPPLQWWSDHEEEIKTLYLQNPLGEVMKLMHEKYGVPPRSIFFKLHTSTNGCEVGEYINIGYKTGKFSKT